MANATLPPYPSFDTEDDISALPQKWEEWVDGLEDMMAALAVTDHARKWSMLKFYGGDKIRKLEKQLAYDKAALFGADAAGAGGRTDHYAQLKTALTNHFAPCVNETFARFQFRSISQDENESIDTFITRTRSQAAHCNFHAEDLNGQIRDQIVFGCNSKKIRRKALAENLALDRLIQVARAEESARVNAEEIEKSTDVPHESGGAGDVFKVSRGPGRYSNKSTLANDSRTGRQRNSDQQPNPPQADSRCFECGGKFPHSKEKPCPAIGKTCNKCSKPNHFASVCKSDGKVLAAAVEDKEQDSSDEEFTSSLMGVRHIGSIIEKPNLLTIKSDRGAIIFNPDTGADVTIMDPYTFSRLKSRPTLSTTGIKLLPYGAKQPLRMSGRFTLHLEYNGIARKETCFVSHNSNKGVSLLSRAASKALGLVTLNYLPAVNQMLIRPVGLDGSSGHPLLSQFEDVCEGVGCHKDIALSLPLKEGAQHTVAPHLAFPSIFLPK